MIIAITGGSGFIGRQLAARHLERGDDVRVLSRQAREKANDPIRWFRGDLAVDQPIDLAFVADVDVLYHLAAELFDESTMRATNVEGVERLIAGARGRVGKLVQLSSVGVYGPVRSGDVTEAAAKRPVGRYEVSKWDAECLVAEAAANGAFDCAVLRPTKIYGPGMRPIDLKFLSTLIARRRFVHLGGNDTTVNYVHAADVVSGLVALGDVPTASGPFNIGEPSTMSVLVSAIARAHDVPPPTKRIPRPVGRFVAATAGRIPRFPLTLQRFEAMNSTVRYLSDHLERTVGVRASMNLESEIHHLIRNDLFAPAA